MVIEKDAKTRKNGEERKGFMKMNRKFRAFAALLLCAVLLAGCASGGGSISGHTGITIPTAETAAVNPNVPEGAVVVSNVEELVAAIAPETCIYLLPGVYNLSASNAPSTAYAQWEEVYDGKALVISGVYDMVLMGEGADVVTVETDPRYADVFAFRNCADILVQGMTLGHTREPGSCVGGVLDFFCCTGAKVFGCALYGCGIMGISAEECVNLRVSYTDIYECSEGAVYLSGCTNALIEECSIHDCGIMSGVLTFNSCDQVGFINSKVLNNVGSSEYGAVIRSSSRGVYIGGVFFESNVCFDLFSNSWYPLTVEGCEFVLNEAAWPFEGCMIVNEAGMEVSGDYLQRSVQHRCTWTPTDPAGNPANPQPNAEGITHVASVDEFLAAIAPGATVYLEPGVYDLTEATDYGGPGGMYYTWRQDVDGAELVIYDVDHLIIEGAGKDLVKIVTRPRYADVICFESCTDLTLQGFTAGHTLEPGFCSGGVVSFTDTNYITMENCGLYGCGVVGIHAMNVDMLLVKNTEIYECSEGACWFIESRGIRLVDCTIRDIGGPWFWAVDCWDVYVNDEPIPNEE